MVSEPPLILAFDTSAAHCAAALVRGTAVLSRRDEPMDRGQAERLLPMLGEMLAEAATPWAALDGIAVVTGPGNFTGLRLAVAAARGLALALSIPAVGVSRFEALAAPAGSVRVTLTDKRGAMAQSFRDGVPLAPPGDAAATPPDPETGPPARAITDGRADLAIVAGIASRRLHAAPPPAPLYLRPADAMPPADAPPRILDDA